MILGVIPARAGSRGIPNKNIKPLLGKPLIVWSIEDAKRSKLLDHFLVSTDGPDIANLALWAGAEVQMRPYELAQDHSTTLEVLQFVQSTRPADIIVLLQPTSPIRGKILDEAIRTFLAHDCDTLATGYWTTHCAWTNQHGPRQSLPEYFHDDGCVYIWKSEVIAAGRWMGDKPHRMSIPNIYNVEIDTQADFWAVEGILAQVKDTLYE